MTSWFPTIGGVPGAAMAYGDTETGWSNFPILWVQVVDLRELDPGHSVL